MLTRDEEGGSVRLSGRGACSRPLCRVVMTSPHAGAGRPDDMTPIARSVIVASLFAASTASAQVSTSASALIDPRTTWPSVTAIAIFTPEPYSAVKVEASSDGWILLTPLSGSDGRQYPSHRVFVAPVDAMRWVTAVRAALERASRNPGLTRDSVDLPALGVGAARFQSYQERGAPFFPYPLVPVVCRQGGTISLTATEFARLAHIVEEAARAASAFRDTPRPPTLARPYFASEVECAAQPHHGNLLVAYPELGTGRARPTLDVGVRFIVDTAGRVEPGSFTTLPDVPTEFAKAARRTVEAWQFTPATWAGLPVRQVANVTLTFDPSAMVPGASPREFLGGRPQPRMQFIVAEDGSVRITQADWRQDGTLEGAREWFAPDSLRRWLVRVDSMLAEDRVRPKIYRGGQWGGPAGFGVGYGGYTFLEASYPTVRDVRDSVSLPDSVLRLRALLSGCRGRWYHGESIDSAFLARVRRVIARAATFRPALTLRIDGEYTRNEVACPASLSPRIVNDARYPGVSFPSTGPYSREMLRRKVRAEVMSSFVVDSTGRVEHGSLLLMSGTDTAVAGALRRGITSYRFNPAAKSGRRVRQRLVMAWTFVPPPSCETGNEGIECPRGYSPNVEPPSSRRSTQPPLRSAPAVPPAPPSAAVERDTATITNPALLLEGAGALVVRVDLGKQGNELRPGLGSNVLLHAESLAVIPGNAASASVGESGIVRLNGLPSGRYDLHVRRIGFEGTSLKVRIVAGFTDTVSVSLKQAHGCDICGDIVIVRPRYRPCAKVAPALARRIAALRERLATPAQAEYRASLGIAHQMAPGDIAPETGDAICDAVTDAVRRFTGATGPATTNFLVLRAGSRYIAIDPRVSVSPLYSLSARFDDVRMSLLQ